MSSRVPSGVEPPRSDHLVAERRTDPIGRPARAVEDRRHDDHGSLAGEWDSVDDLRRGERVHRVSRRTFGKSGRAAGEDDGPTGFGRRGQRLGGVRRDDVVQGLRARGDVRAVVHPDQHARQVSGQRVEQTEELAVVQHHADVFALTDLRELRLRKTRVHQHHPGAELAACGHRDGKAAVVAAQHTDDGAGGDTEALQPVRQSPRLVVDLLVGQRPAFVDDRGQGRIPAPAHDRHRRLWSVDGRELGGPSRRAQILQIDDAGAGEASNRTP